jgi:hypothetical protein
VIASEVVRDATRFGRSAEPSAIACTFTEPDGSPVTVAEFRDQAAGAMLVEEAGGRVTDLDGLPLDFTTGRRLLRNTGLLAAKSLLHDAALKIVRHAKRQPAKL